jgi:hypothetical protein
MVLGPALLGAATAMLLASVGRRSGRGAEPFYAPDAPAAPPASGLPPAAAQQAPLAAAAIAESATRLSEGLERAGACESVMACDKWFARLLALSDEAAWMSRGDRRARFLELRPRHRQRPQQRRLNAARVSSYYTARLTAGS